MLSYKRPVYREGLAFSLSSASLLVGLLIALCFTEPLMSQAQAQPPTERSEADIRRQPTPSSHFQNIRGQLSVYETERDRMRIYGSTMMIPAYSQPDSIRFFARKALADSLILEKNRNILYHQIMGYSYSAEQVDSSVHHLRIAKELAKQIGNTLHYLNAVNTLMIVFQRNDRILEAEAVILDGIEVASASENPQIRSFLAPLYNSAGILYSRVLAYDQAAYMFSQMLDYSDNTMMRCNASLSLSRALIELGRTNEAFELLQNCEDEEQYPPQLVAMRYITESRARLHQGDTLTAIQYLETAGNWSLQSPDVQQQAMILAELAGLHLKLSQTDQARQTIELFDEPQYQRLNPQTRINLYLARSRYYHVTEELQQSLEWSDRAIQLGYRPEYVHLLGSVYTERSKIYEELGQIDKALEASRRQVELTSSIIDATERQELANARVRHQLRLNEAELAAAVKRSEQSRLRFWIVTILSFGLLVSALLLLRQYRTSRTVAVSLSDQLRTAEQEQDALRASIQSSMTAVESNKLIEFSKQLRIATSSISHIEADGNYVRIYRPDEDRKTIMERTTLKKCESMLSETQFRRAHRSALVNIEHIERIENQQVHLKGGHVVSISKRYKKAFLQGLQSD